MEPAAIKKLDAAVVNRIAAGEVIQRPANALKELLENSLDAKSNFIQITVKGGGLKMLQIQDNGTGIRRDDLEIVCERFTTSKLQKFEDLSNIGTFGFRGEALASISHVAHLTIQTKTAQERCGYKACYTDGKLKEAPKPCASNQGTIITIEELFYNMPQRKQALKSVPEEYQRISDVVSKYAVHNYKVGFMLKKHGEARATLKTNLNSTLQENIRLIYGFAIYKELLPIELSDVVHRFKMKGLITKVNYAAKRSNMLLFINQRMVESTALKNAIHTVYSTYLPKGAFPFIYISLDLEPTNVDVNVHPTKHEVHFLYEEEIIEKIRATVESQLLGSNSTRTFYKQLKLPGVTDTETDSGTETLGGSQSPKIERVHAKDLIRTDAKEQKLDKFLYSNKQEVGRGGGGGGAGKLCKTDSSESNNNYSSSAMNESFRITAARKSKEVKLTSVLEMQNRVEKACSVLLRKTVKEMVFVGVVDRTFALFQHETKLYLCNTTKFCEELLYQRLVYEFENFQRIKIEPKLPIKELILIALDNEEESGWTAEDGDKQELATQATAIIQQRADLLREYFALSITATGELESLPALLEQYCPSHIFLPQYMLRLATDVEWELEEKCFETFCRETAYFYARCSEFEMQQDGGKRHKWQVEHVIYPALKRYLLPPNALKQQLYELTNLSTLYKVFERC